MSRAGEILDAKGASPKRISDRDRAYVCDLYGTFGDQDFSLSQIQNRRLSTETMTRFGVHSGRLDDRTVLGIRLRDLGLLHLEGSTYRLTKEGVELGRELKC